jgi:hypothetical protein
MNKLIKQMDAREKPNHADGESISDFCIAIQESIPSK